MGQSFWILEKVSFAKKPNAWPHYQDSVLKLNKFRLIKMCNSLNVFVFSSECIFAWRRGCALGKMNSPQPVYLP